MNALFSSALQAVKWAKKYEGQGYTVSLEVRGNKVFASATRGPVAVRKTA
jgi:hypothetical protein